MHAIRANEPKMVETLLENGADPAKRNYLGLHRGCFSFSLSMALKSLVF